MKNFHLFLLVLVLSTNVFAAQKDDANKSCGEGQHWVKAHFRRAYVRADGVSFKATNVRAHCSKNPFGYSFWEPNLKNGFPNNWPHKDENQKQWIEEEIERMLEALSYLPQALWPNQIQGIYRLAKSRFFPNPASEDSSGDIAIYDTAFDKSNNLSQILAHELAHGVFNALPPQDQKDYRDATGWYDISKTGEPPNWYCVRQGFVDEDGRNSPDEDFSNNVEFYLFNPSKLKQISPTPYNWIAAHFGANFKLGKGSS